jgi:hypothetical protein
MFCKNIFKKITKNIWYLQKYLLSLLHTIKEKHLTSTHMTRSEIFTLAHSIANNTKANFSSYRLAFATALTIVYSNSKPSTKMEIPAKFQDAIQAINNGGKFNGVVYGKNNGKNWTSLSVYVDNKFYNLGSVPQTDAEASKKEFLSFVNVSNNTQPKNEWLVNEKKVNNKLNYGQMYNKYGMDFE